MARSFTVSVIGNGTLSPDDPRWVAAHRLGTALVDHGYVVVTGGLGGVMQAASMGARASARHHPGAVVGLLPGADRAGANPFVDVAVPTGLGHLRNGLVARSDAVVAIGGGAGTLTELGLAWVFDRLVIAYRLPGWSGRLADERLDERVRFADRPDDRVVGVDTAEEVVAVLARYLRGS